MYGYNVSNVHCSSNLHEASLTFYMHTWFIKIMVLTSVSKVPCSINQLYYAQTSGFHIPRTDSNFL